MAKSYYDILGVAEDANEEAIRNGYLKAMRDKHPDLHSGDDVRADSRVRELNAARDTLVTDADLTGRIIRPGISSRVSHPPRFPARDRWERR